MSDRDSSLAITSDGPEYLQNGRGRKMSVPWRSIRRLSTDYALRALSDAASGTRNSIHPRHGPVQPVLYPSGHADQVHSRNPKFCSRLRRLKLQLRRSDAPFYSLYRVRSGTGELY